MCIVGNSEQLLWHCKATLATPTLFDAFSHKIPLSLPSRSSYPSSIIQLKTWRNLWTQQSQTTSALEQSPGAWRLRNIWWLNVFAKHRVTESTDCMHIEAFKFRMTLRLTRHMITSINRQEREEPPLRSVSVNIWALQSWSTAVVWTLSSDSSFLVSYVSFWPSNPVLWAYTENQ